MNKEARNLLLWVIGIVLLVVLVSQFLIGEQYQKIGYQTFKEQLRKGRVKTLVEDNEELRGKFAPGEVKSIEIDGESVTDPSFTRLKEAVESDKEITINREELPEGKKWEDLGDQYFPKVSLIDQEDGETTTVRRFKTILPSSRDHNLQGLVDTAFAIYSEPTQNNLGTEGNEWLRLLLYASIPIIILIVFWFYLSSRMGGQAGGGIMNIGKMKGEVFDKETQVDTSFDDVAGLDSAKEDMMEVIKFLKNPKQFHQLGGTVPKGVLLMGPPGTGKTLMARAVAGEAGVPFFSLTGSSFMEMFVGVGAARVRDLFDSAKENKPAIIFIDELESVGRKRGAGVGGGHDEREQTLNQLLSEMDGFEPRDNIVVIGATNRPDILDQAIQRPGRFDREITVDMPTVKEREQILDVHVRDVPLAEEVDLHHIAQGTPGFSGADLENLINEAAIKAAREEDTKVRMPYFEYAMDRIMLGRKREGLVLSEEDKRLVAYHEAGHAIVAQFTEHADPLFKVTIIPRRRSLGCTKQIPEEEKFNYSREYLLARLQVILGGRAAEHLIFDTFTTGGGDDLKKAKEISHNMVCDYGMSEKIGHVSLGNGDDEVFLGQDIGSQRNYSEKTAQIVDEEISEITSSCFENAVETLKEHREELDDLAEALIERESLERHQIYEILGLEDELEDEQEHKDGPGGGTGDHDGVEEDEVEADASDAQPPEADSLDEEAESVTGETDTLNRSPETPETPSDELDTPQQTTKSMRPSPDEDEESEASSSNEADDSNNTSSDDTKPEQEQE